MPTQRAAEMGLFFVKERPIVSGENPIYKTYLLRYR